MPTNKVPVNPGDYIFGSETTGDRCVYAVTKIEQDIVFGHSIGGTETEIGVLIAQKGCVKPSLVLTPEQIATVKAIQPAFRIDDSVLMRREDGLFSYGAVTDCMIYWNSVTQQFMPFYTVRFDVGSRPGYTIPENDLAKANPRTPDTLKVGKSYYYWPRQHVFDSYDQADLVGKRVKLEKIVSENCVYVRLRSGYYHKIIVFSGDLMDEIPAMGGMYGRNVYPTALYTDINDHSVRCQVKFIDGETCRIDKLGGFGKTVWHDLYTAKCLMEPFTDQMCQRLFDEEKAKATFCRWTGDPFQGEDDKHIIGELGNEMVVNSSVLDNQAIVCEECGAIIIDRTATTVHSSEGVKRIGPRCFDHARLTSHTICRCAECDDWWYTDDLVESVCGLICPDCASVMERCDSCGSLEYPDRLHTVRGQRMCRNCWQDTNRLMNYWYKPRPIFYAEPDGHSDDALYMGVELEVDERRDEELTEDDQTDTIIDLCGINDDLNKSLFYCKHDGSLHESGIEIVTHPATLAYHEKEFPWRRIVDTCLSHDYVSHDARTCGLHVHVSRKALGADMMEQDLTTAKLVILFDRFWPQLVKFSRRRTDQFRWCRKLDAGIRATDKMEELIFKAKARPEGGDHEARYYAINLQNEHTVEFRLFRGTLVYRTLMATLEFVDFICRYARKASLEDVMNVLWTEMIAKIPADMEALRGYLTERGLVEGPAAVAEDVTEEPDENEEE